MPITTRFAVDVRSLRRQGMTVAEIAAHLGQPEADVLEAHRMMGIGIADLDDQPAPRLSDAQREAAIDRLPKKMQERIRRARS